MRPLAILLAAAVAATPVAAQEPGEAAPEAPQAADASDAASAAALSLNPLSSLDKATLRGFRDMPLFTPSRRRPEPEQVVEAPPAPPPVQRPRAPEPAPELKLSGVVQGPEGAVAVVDNDGTTERLRLGDQVGGWLVTAIDAAALKLTLDDREQQYRMFQRAGGETAAGDGAAEDAGDETAEPDPRAPRDRMRRRPPASRAQDTE